ncbi:MAG TPA: phosphoenolpyruvate kinase [Terriglobia bacterium]
MRTTLDPELVADATLELRKANPVFRSFYPGDAGQRQPVHTFYGGAHLFKANAAGRLGALALKSLEEYAPDSGSFAAALGLPAGALAEQVYPRVVDKLRREPVEDFRIDFEDGYGNRPDAEEDQHAVAAAAEVAQSAAAGSLPPFIGLRIKPLTEELQARSLHTLDLFLTALLAETGGVLPPGLLITLPKVTVPEQPAALAKILDRFEEAAGLPAGKLHFEIMIETTQAILNRQGQSNLPLLLDAGAGRCIAAHFGTYDYTASCGITAAHQHMLHPACDFARAMMQVALGGTGIWLSDGGTNVLPVPLHRGYAQTPAQQGENREAIHRAWKLHFDHVQHSLENGFYQGWDLHPAQLPTRYAAVYAFYLGSVAGAATRLRNLVRMAARATALGNVFDDAATGQGLLNFFLRALNCGAIDQSEAEQRTGLTAGELRGGSFLRILEGRRA